MEAKKFGQFIAGIRKEKKMTQAELAGKIHVTDKAISRWERGLGFPDIQTLEPLAQALGISVLELMRSERQETEKQDQQPEEFRYTQGEVAEMLQNAGDISRQQKKQDRDANVIAGIVLAAITIIVWMTKLASFGRSTGGWRDSCDCICVALVFLPEYRRCRESENLWRCGDSFGWIFAGADAVCLGRTAWRTSARRNRHAAGNFLDGMVSVCDCHAYDGNLPCDPATENRKK